MVKNTELSGTYKLRIQGPFQKNACREISVNLQNLEDMCYHVFAYFMCRVQFIKNTRYQSQRMYSSKILETDVAI